MTADGVINEIRAHYVIAQKREELTGQALREATDAAVADPSQAALSRIDAHEHVHLMACGAKDALWELLVSLGAVVGGV